MFNLKNYIEVLADLEHKSWARWQLYFHTKGVKKVLIRFPDEAKEILTFEIGYINALESQANTEYKDLTESEKESDRSEVKELEETLKKIYQDGYNKAVEDYNKLDYFSGV